MFRLLTLFIILLITLPTCSNTALAQTELEQCNTSVNMLLDATIQQAERIRTLRDTNLALRNSIRSEITWTLKPECINANHTAILNGQSVNISREGTRMAIVFPYAKGDYVLSVTSSDSRCGFVANYLIK